MKKLMQEQNTRPEELTSFVLFITEKCNLRCDYCFVSKRRRHMSTETIDASVDFIFNASSSPSRKISICFFGGEPLMVPKTIEYICERALERSAQDNREVSFSMTSNGTLINNRNLKLIQKYDIKTKVSIDGIGEAQDRHRKQVNGTGSFDLIVKNIDNLLSLPGVTIRVTVTPDTVTSLIHSIHWLADKGFKHIFFTPVVEAEWSEISLAALYDCYRALLAYQIEKKGEVRIKNVIRDHDRLLRGDTRTYGCGAAVRMAAIDTEGFLYPCQRFVGYFRNSGKCRIGDVYNGIHHEKRNYYIENNRIDTHTDCGIGLYLQNTSVSDRKCQNCRLFPVCHSSCIAINEFMTGNPNVPSPINRILAQIAATNCLTLLSDEEAEFEELEC